MSYIFMIMVIFQFQKVFFILYLNRKHKIYFNGIGYFSVSKSVFHFIPKSKVANEKDIRTSHFKEVYIYTHTFMSKHYLQANYQLSYFFPLPEDMCLCDLNDKTKVKEYFFRYNELNIIFANGSATTIKPEMDKDFDEQYHKKPDTWFPIVKVDDELFSNEPVNHSDDDEIHCLHKEE